MPIIRSGEEDKGPAPEDLEREAARDLQRAGGPGPRRSPGAMGGWTPPLPGEPLMRDEPDDEAGDEEEAEFRDDEAVTELALGWLAEQSKAGERSLEDVIVKVDPESAYAARDRALQQFMERRAVLQENLPKVPWDPSRRLTIGKRRPRAGAKEQPGKKTGAKRSVASKKVSKKQVGSAIKGYDRLSPAEVISRLDDLTDEQLDTVADYEEQNQNRAEILDAIDDLFEAEDEEPAPPPPAKKQPSQKKPGKKPGKKAAGKKAAGKKAAGKKAAGKKQQALPMEDYDQLTPAEIISRLDDLTDEDLDRLADYEEQYQNRAEILDAIDDLFEVEEEQEEAPPPKKKAAKKSGGVSSKSAWRG